MKEMVLIHGWDTNCYNSKIIDKPVAENIAWTHRNQLLSLLSSNFRLTYFNLPGFCGTPEPKKDYFNVEDFTNYFNTWISKQEKQPEIILGYSFGGVVALDYKVRYKLNIPIILISPALLRSTSLKSRLAQHGKNLIPEVLSKQLKGQYQHLFSKYYREGSSFLRNSYDHIVRRDMSRELAQVDKNSILLIYGAKDTSTPWLAVKDKTSEADLDYLLIANGEHSIGQTHPKEIVDAINAFLNKNEI